MTKAREAELKKEADYQGEGGTMTILGGEVLELLKRKDVSAIAHEIAEKMCGCDPGYCPCDGLHSKEAVEAEIIRRFS